MHLTGTSRAFCAQNDNLGRKQSCMTCNVTLSTRLLCFATAEAVTSIKVGTRGSKLAKLQGEKVQLLLRKVKPQWTAETFKTVSFTTHGDERKEGQLRELGQGAFTEVIDKAVAEGKVDIGVHSLKDSPVQLPDGVELAACLPRDEPRGPLSARANSWFFTRFTHRDAFISLTARTLAELPPGARVGTSSLRRKAQLLHAHPHLNIVPVRGNIDARLEMLQTGELDALVLAAAGLARLGQQALITRVLDFDEMLPAACQGAVGVTCSASDPFIRWELGLICHEPTRMEVAAERAMLSALLTTEDTSTTSSQGPREQQHTGPSGSGGAGKGPAGTHLPVTSSTAVSTPPPTTPSIQGISSITGLPLLPSFAIACHAGFDPHDGLLKVEGLIASEDGRTLHRLCVTEGAASPGDAEEIGSGLGRQLRALAQQHGWMDD